MARRGKTHWECSSCLALYYNADVLNVTAADAMILVIAVVHVEM